MTGRTTRMRTLAVGPARFRFGPWQGRDDTAQLVPLTPAPTLRPDVIDTVLRRLGAAGYELVYTAAVGAAEARCLAERGFAEHEHLHLLRHTRLDTVAAADPSRPWRVRRARSRDRDAVLAIDRAAFEPFWALDELALTEALAATPRSRFRLARARRPVAYAIAGLAGDIAYLQRLAVHPDAQGRGLGAVLAVDALRWAARRGAHAAYVNTQRTNARALELYERLGFVRDGELVVLRAEPGRRA
ncbi:MAG: GNAT family N-acetyltransferase [Actinomyces sp.]|nr:MAG: GNAT family N-acetyltransferase [Actinomyces sp.]